MKQRREWLCGVFLAVILCGVSLAARGQETVALVIYEGDLALVQAAHEVIVQKGEQRITLSGLSEKLDPSTLAFRFPHHDVEVLEQTYHSPVGNTEALLRYFVGDTVTIVLKGGGIASGRLTALVSSDPLLQEPGGSVVLIAGREIQQVHLPETVDRLTLEPWVELKIRSGTSGRIPLEVTYLTEGLVWTATYNAFLDESDTRLELESWAQVENHTGADFRAADLILVAGEVGRARTERPGPLRRGVAEMAMAAAPAPSAFEERPMFEYHEFQLGRSIAIRDGEQKQLRLLPILQGRCKKSYVYDGERDGQRVRVRIEAENKKSDGFGQPLPRGTVRIFRRTGKRLRFLGEDQIEHVSVGANLGLDVGYAFDIQGERTLMASEQVGRNAREETVSIRLKNGKEEAVNVRVVEHLRGDWEIRKSSHPFEKVSAYEIRFDVTVPAGGESSIEYTALIRY